MQVQTSLFIILAAIVALGIVFFQYFFQKKRRGNLVISLSFLRFIALLGLFILLINPKFSKTSLTLDKPNLIVLTDNSSSVKDSENDIRSVLKAIRQSDKVGGKFNVMEYNFGKELKNSDSLTFSDRNTDISKAISTLDRLHDRTNSAVILVTDGNQTLGADYRYLGNEAKFPIYPIVIGDTTTFEDLRIDQVNVNRYAFLKNKFPVEVYINYEGENQVNSATTIEFDGKVVYRENLIFSPIENTKIVNTQIESNSVGPKSIKVSIASLDNERNKLNNQKTLAIEVIDEKTNITIVSDLIHPDLGALKKALESNEQRTVTIKKPTADIKEFEATELFILYQPSSSFNEIQKHISKKNSSVFVITGNNTNWKFVNELDPEVTVEEGYPKQDIFGVLNRSFTKYDISEYSFEGYPPLESNSGAIRVSGDFEALINMQIKGVDVGSPLLFVKDDKSQKKAFLIGQNIWKWRMQNYRDNQDFKKFDDLVGKLVLYLTSSKPKNRLQVDYKSVYEGSNVAKITATYFDEGFEFDPSASITLKLDGNNNGIKKEIPMLLKSGYYETDLSGLPSGNYDFNVNVQPENRSKTGNFTILDFDVEQQFSSSDYKKLALLASNSGGSVFFPSEVESLIQNVTNDPRFRPIQSSIEKVVSLIDFRLLLAIIVAALSLEWFIRKYNGLT